MSLKNHPFAVDARFDFSLVLTWALPTTTLQPLLPPQLQLDTFDGRATEADGGSAPVGFIAIAMVQTRGLRPSRMPGIFGRDFFLIGTRVFARCTVSSGQRLRGLYIVRSQTNRASMRVLGDVFTRYRYEPINVDIVRNGGDIAVTAGAFHVDVDTSDARVEGEGEGADGPEQSTSLLPPGSCFQTWKDARRFAGPMPYTFSTVKDPSQILIVEGVRQQWRPRAVRVREARVPFFAERGLDGAVLASAFIVENVPYHWKAGRLEHWAPPDGPGPT